MELFEAKKLALDLMIKHKLFDWSFKFNNRKRCYGLCHYRKKTIFLSKPLIPAMSEDAVKNTILHEIAHALVGVGHNHNYVWRRKAIEIGCDGNRTADYGIDVDAKYKATCCKCGKTFKAYRKPKVDHWCKCTNRTFKQEEKLIYSQQY